MSLFHSRPVAVQRVYYKPSAMDRLKALFTPRHHQHVARPRTTAAPRRTLGRKRVVRQPVRKTGFFHRSPRRTVVATQKRPGFFASLRPHHARRTRVTPAPVLHGRRHHYRGHNKHHKGSTMAAVIAALSMKKRSHKHRY
ncbi:hypothetical protein BGZ70_000448 [Mortierella alpina]|uniref:Uncharacterized protein n=1 Tax=Mortierella alpina TaxID=64518 RepID=A0A9P6IXZ1_MORAP|nr:hypothetical protein BGZ70_000448 [Mortierella alpina]